MPEGDSIHKIANFLAPRLRERRVHSLVVGNDAAARDCDGCRIRCVVARGKHLFIDFDNGMSVRSHLGMHGAWHRYPAGEAWRKPGRRASLVLVLGEREAGKEIGAAEVYVCFNAREVELLRSTGIRRRIIDSRLGPDLLAQGPDFPAIVRRAREIPDPEATIADLLLDQRIASGIGNVYKSEVLFINRRLPQRRVTGIGDDELKRHFELAADLLTRNLGGGKRVTRFERDAAGSLWVYRRSGQPCLRCDEGYITSARIGRHHRSTYWCVRCQQ